MRIIKKFDVYSRKAVSAYVTSKQILPFGFAEQCCLIIRNRTVGTQQTQNICIICVQRWPNIFDVGPTLYKCYTNVLCVLGKDFEKHH